MLLFCLLSYLLILIISIKINKQPDNTKFLNIKFTNQIRGLAILAILVSHLINMLYYSRDSSISVIKFIFCVLAPIGVGLFFFLSGYGNVFSISKQCNITWLGKKISRLFITILPVLLTLYIFSYILRINLFTKYSVINDFLTLSIPPFTTWYLKVQLFAYLLLFLCYKFFKRQYTYILFGLCLVYTIYCILSEIAGMWWVSTICFALGVIYAKSKEKFVFKFTPNLYHTIFLFLLSAIFFILIIPFKAKATFWLCIISCLLMSNLSILITLKSKILDFLGTYSLEVYCVHLALIAIIEKINFYIPNENNYKMILVFILTMLLVPHLKNFCDIIEKKLLR